jgi:hypothetical protein
MVMEVVQRGRKVRLNTNTRTSGNLEPRSRVKGLVKMKNHRGNITVGGFVLNPCKRILAEGRPG